MHSRPKRKILSIEDTDSFRLLIRMTLEFEGFEVLEALDGQSGLDLVRKTIPDLILLDLMLPDIKGLDVCRQIMADSRLCQIPIVVLSSSTDSDDIEHCMQAGAQALATSEQTAQHLSELSEDLKNSTDVAKSAEEVASAAEELSSAVQEISRSGSQIMTAIDQIRRGADVQSAGSEESSAAITQIERGAQVAMQRGQVSAEKVAAIRALLATNKTSVDSLIANVLSSADASKVSIKQVKELALVSRRIDKIVDAITTVSIQTNMLAVNGSIEAARAGEFGKGFVVVATDIRNLAQDSAENADRIKDLVKAVQDQIAVVGRDLDEIVATALSEVEKAKTTTANLVSIETSIADVEKGASEILAAANEIGAAVAQVKRGIEQISAAAQEAAKASDEAAAAAKQQFQGAEELASAIEEISSLADELQSA